MRMHLRLVVWLVCMIGPYCSPAAGQTLTWNGLGDGTTFSQAANWSPASIPGSGNDCIISGGAAAVTVGSSSSIRSLTTARNVNLSGCGALTFSSGLTLSGGAVVTINNTCTSQTALTFSGGTQFLGGSGEIVVVSSGTGGNVLSANSCQLTIGPGITVRFGSGATGTATNIIIGSTASLTNQGTIACRQSGKTLTIGGSGSFSSAAGVLEATSAGILQINTTLAPMNASNLGTVTRSGGGQVLLPNLAGGTLLPATDGLPFTITNNLAFSGVTIATNLNLSGCGILTVTNGMALSGGAVVTIDDTCTSAALTFSGGIQALSGRGEIAVINTGSSGTAISASSCQLTIGAGVVVRLGPSATAASTTITVGSTSSLTNLGTIACRQSAKTLIIGGSGAFSNASGTLEASAGGIIRLGMTTAMNASNVGTVLRSGGGTLVLPNLTGGTLTPAADGMPFTVTGTLAFNGVTLATNLTLSGCGVLTVTNGLTLAGGAVVTIDNTCNTAAITFSSGTQTFGGDGELALISTGPVGTALSASSCQLTIGQGVTIRFGPGAIGAPNIVNITIGAGSSIANLGTIACRQAGKTLTIGGGGSFSNAAGTLEATNGGTVQVSIALNAGHLGSIIRSGGGQLILPNLSGGTLAPALDGQPYMVTGSLSFNAVTLASRLNLSGCGSITITGGLTLASGAAVTIENTCNSSALTFSGGTQTLSGKGEVVIINTGTIGNVVSASSCQLTIGPDVTIRLGPGATGTASNIAINSTSSLTNLGTIACRQAGRTLSMSGLGVLANYIPATSTLTRGNWEAASGGILKLTTPSGLTVRDIDAGTCVVVSGASSSLINSNLANLLTQLSSNSGTLTLSGQSLLVAPPQGQFLNDGTVAIEPGGVLQITGEFVQSAAATLAIRAAGAAPSQFGRLVATDRISLAGTLDARPIPPYAPELSTLFAIATGATRHGEFTSVSGGDGFQPVACYDNTSASVYFYTCPFVTTQPANVTSCQFAAANFTLEAAGTLPISYQWQFRSGPDNDWINLDEGNNSLGDAFMFNALGVDTNSLTLERSDPWPTGEYGQFRCKLTNACATVTSDAAWLVICVADFNCDGGIDGSDVEIFFAAWESGDIAGDVNADGGVDGADIGVFFDRWEAGC